MYSIAGKVIDFFDDPDCMGNAEFVALLGGVEKVAETSEADADYAVVLRGVQRYRRFPIFNKLATTASATYFNDHVENLHPHIRVVAACHIKRACLEFGVAVPANVLRYSQVPAPLETNVLYLAQMPAYQHTAPVKTAEYVAQRMIDFWNDNLARMSPAERSDKATKLASVVSADKLPASARNYVVKEAHGTLLGPAINQRIRLVRGLENKTAAAEYSELLKVAGTTAPATVVKMLAALDTTHKLGRFYGKLADPYQSVYGDLYKRAQDIERPEEDETALAYKLQTLAAETSDYEYPRVLSASGLADFRKDPVGTFRKLPKVVQDFLLADFESRLAKHQALPVDPYMSEERITHQTKRLRDGDRHDCPVAMPKKMKHDRAPQKYPKLVYEKVTG